MNRLSCATLISFMNLAVASAGAQTMTPAPPKLGGYIQLRETAIERAGISAALNRARFSIDGALPQHFSYRALVELEASAGVKNPGVVSLRVATIKWAIRPTRSPPDNSRRLSAASTCSRSPRWRPRISPPWSTHWPPSTTSG